MRTLLLTLCLSFVATTTHAVTFEFLTGPDFGVDTNQSGDAEASALIGVPMGTTGPVALGTLWITQTRTSASFDAGGRDGGPGTATASANSALLLTNPLDGFETTIDITFDFDSIISGLGSDVDYTITEFVRLSTGALAPGDELLDLDLTATTSDDLVQQITLAPGENIGFLVTIADRSDAPDFQFEPSSDTSFSAAITNIDTAMPPIPLPASFPLLLAALGAVALTLRRRAA